MMSDWKLRAPIDVYVGGAHADLLFKDGTDEARSVHISGALSAVAGLVKLATTEAAAVAGDEEPHTVWRIVISGGGGALAAMLFEAPAGKGGDLTLEDLNAIEQNASQILKCEAVALSWARLTTTSTLAARAKDTACDPASQGSENRSAPADAVAQHAPEAHGTLPFTPRPS